MVVMCPMMPVMRMNVPQTVMELHMRSDVRLVSGLRRDWLHRLGTIVRNLVLRNKLCHNDELRPMQLAVVGQASEHRYRKSETKSGATPIAAPLMVMVVAHD